MSYGIRFNERVAGDLRAIAAWVIARAGPDSAERRLAEIDATIEGLAALPHKGSLRDEIAPRLRVVPAGRRGVVAFTVDDEAREVLVIVVSFGGGDWAARVRERT